MDKQSYKLVGKRIPKLDDWDRVTGNLAYGVELELPGMLFGGVFRSKWAHAKLLHIETSRARRAPGVVSVITGQQVPFSHGRAVKDEPFLAVDEVRYVGEPIVAISAISVEAVQEALGMIQVEGQELPAVFDTAEAMRVGAPLVHEDLGRYEASKKSRPLPGTNICRHFKLRRGDVSKGFAVADHTFEDTFKFQMMNPCALESHMAIALAEPSGKVVVWSNTQAPHRFREELAAALGIPLNQMRIIITELGGGFGGKLHPRVEPLAIALALSAKGRPVKVQLSRSEIFTGTVVRHPATVALKTGVLKDGTLVAREATIIYDTGAYAICGPFVAQNGGVTAAGPYRIPHVKIDSYAVYTNNPVAGAVRGLGTPQVAWAYESQMDMIANALGMDPLELRLKNCFREGDASATGERLTSVGLAETLERAAGAIEYDKHVGPRRTGHGKGLACMFKLTNTPASSSASLMLNEDGTFQLMTSAVEMGQGTETTLAQIVAEEMGVSLKDVTVAKPDTEITPYHEGTSGSRTTFLAGRAVQTAAFDIKQQLIQMAVHIMEEDPDNLEVRDRGVYVRGTSRGLSFCDVVRKYYGTPAMLLGRGFFTAPGTAPLDPETGQSPKPSAFWMYATQGAEVEVDSETGQVKVVKLVAAHDCGKAINLMGCEQQIEGALVQGLGLALYEEQIVTNGKTLNPNLSGYLIPTVADVPPLVPILVEATHPDGPYGAKGLGEPALTATAPAIANAVFDAVGVRITDLPITAEKIWKALAQQTKCSQTGIKP